MRIILASLFCLVACSDKNTATTTTTPTGSATPVEPAKPDPAEPMTPEACTGQGGEVRGDIGDGKIACNEGEQDLGKVKTGIEGGVCCKK